MGLQVPNPPYKMNVLNGNGLFSERWTKFIVKVHQFLTKNEIIMIDVGDETTDLSVGTAKKTFRIPFAFYVKDIRASVNTAPVGSTIIVDINEDGTTILSTKLTIDAGEETSTTAATAHVISDASIADNAEITIDIDQVGSSTAGKGLKIILYGVRP